MAAIPLNRSELEVADSRVLHESRSVVLLLRDLGFHQEDLGIADSEKILVNFNSLKDSGIKGKLVPKMRHCYQAKVTEINYVTKVMSLLLEDGGLDGDALARLVDAGKASGAFSADEEQLLALGTPEKLENVRRLFQKHLGKLLKILETGRQIMGRKLTQVLQLVCVIEGVDQELKGPQMDAAKGLDMFLDLCDVLRADFLPLVDRLELEEGLDLMDHLDMVDEETDRQKFNLLALKMSAKEI